MEYVSAQGVEIPALGFGTARMKGERCRAAVESALEIGYRHIDTAQLYENEQAVGDAIANVPVERDDVFLVTKVRRNNLARDDVLRSVDGSLRRLGTHIDLLLIHAPSTDVPIEESVGAMNELQEDGDVNHIGVSNFSVAELKEAIAASDRPILTNQVKYHPFVDRSDLLDFCLDNEIMLTAYSPVARGDVVGNDTLRAIGETHHKTEAQVALRWLIQQGVVSAIPKAETRGHQEENADIFDFVLTEEEMRRIFELGGGLLTPLRNKLGL